MRLLLAITVVASTALCSGTAAAAPVTVNLRVEGLTQTTFEGPVTTDGKQIDGHPCDGTNGGANTSPGPTMTSALDDASATGAFTWDRTWFDGFDDFGIDRIGPDATDFANSRFWGYAYNYVASSIGGCQQQVAQGDDVLFGFDFFSKSHLLKLEGPPTVETGQPFTVRVLDGQNGAPIAGAAVGGQNTGSDGQASVKLSTPGVHRLKAEEPTSLRSNALELCAYEPGTKTCEGFVPAVASKVRDSSAPSGRITGIRNRAKLKRGPRVLRGTAIDDGSGVDKVKLSLRRHVEGCRWWSRSSERFAGASCKRKVFFSIGSDRNWSYQLPRPLGPGHYVLDVKVVDKSGNRDASPAEGRSRIVFDVLGTRSGKGKQSTARASARAAPVDVMVFGQVGGLIVEARRVVPRQTVVRASGKRCKVAASTPLAALAAGARGRTRLAVKDFGSCSIHNARDGAQLFVQKIGSDSNQGKDGWVYSVNRRVPSIGAGDPIKRLRRGAQVAWFYCIHDSAGRCQPQLQLKASSRRASAGAPVSVEVRAYDDIGRRKSSAGANVAFFTAAGSVGGASLVGADGLATIAAPKTPGRYFLHANLPGSVPAFPVRIEVS
jgi:hypothetical protein